MKKIIYIFVLNLITVGFTTFAISDEHFSFTNIGGAPAAKVNITSPVGGSKTCEECLDATVFRGDEVLDFNSQPVIGDRVHNT